MRRLPIIEETRIFTHENGEEWERKGSCNRCGQCCRSGDPFNGTLGVPAIEGACALYVEVDGLGTCLDRTNPYYQNGCAHWPSHPDHIADKPGCSYVFSKEI